MSASLPATVIVPTIGRPEQLTPTLAAILATEPGPSEVIVVDQSADRTAGAAAASLGDDRTRVIEDEGRGAARARNRGAHAATQDFLLFTDDDCHPARDWVGVGWDIHSAHPRALVSGSVKAAGNRDAIPSVREDSRAFDYTGALTATVLYSGNMAIARSEFLDFGGFDERFPTAGGEDNDLCYRWLCAGRALLYEPGFSVTHLDWRTVDELHEVRLEYARTQGMFYAKHLQAGDMRILRFLLGDVSASIRERVARQRAPAPGAPLVRAELRSIRQNWGRFKSS